MSSKITSYSRVQTHGVSNTLSGATVPVSNDHTDGSWIITDLYDRELMINTGNGNLQYRAGSDIYTVSSSPTLTGIKSITAPIGTWNMSTAAAVNNVTVSINELYGKNIVSINAMIIPENLFLGSNITHYPYDFIQFANACENPLRVGIIQNNLLLTAGVIFQIETTGTAGTNFFRYTADLGNNFLTGDRGIVIVTYID